MKKSNFTPKQNLGKETLFIADYENIKKSEFDWLAAESRLREENDLHTNDS